ncbi:MAG: NAD(P)H-dependent glycerol-3-phosphate dehydrogenase [Acidimicrobiales bacterium]
MHVSVLGAGSFGTTVAAITAVRHPTTLWARDEALAREVREEHTNERYLAGFGLPDSLGATSDLEEAVSPADVVVVGVPSHGFRFVLEQAVPFVRPWVPIVSLTKGFESGTLMRMTEVIAELLPGHPAAALSGPNLAKEIMAGQAAASVIATEDLAVAAELQAVLRRGVFRLYTNHDVIGCEVAGALKNVVAIAAGMAQGVGAGDNTRAAVISRGLAELTRLGVALGGEPQTFAGLAGVGDLVATCMSPQSRNRWVGEQLGRGRPLADILAETTMVAEGVKTAGTAMELAGRHGVEMPICGVIQRVIDGKMTATEAYRGLRAAGHEADPG